MYIKNTSELIGNGRTEAERDARRSCLDALEYALEAVEPAALIKAKVRVTSDRRFLVIDRRRG